MDIINVIADIGLLIFFLFLLAIITTYVGENLK